jgi:sec-independent protein translocase protein TatA
MMATILLGIIGTQEIIIIALVILLLFGGRKIPELMKGFGKGIEEDLPKKDLTDDSK